jgi:hypothetical protein
MSPTTQSILSRLNLGMLAVGFEGLALDTIAKRTPDDLYLLIKAHHNLIADIPEKTADKIRSYVPRMPRYFNMTLKVETVASILLNKRPELYATILNTPGGREWLEWQVAEARRRLNLTT